MFSGRFLSRVSHVTVIALFVSSCVSEDPRRNGSSSQPQQGGNILGSLAPSPWVLDPDFQKTVIPHITNTWEFSSFMQKYSNARNLSEKDAIDALIQLGVFKYAPQWVKPDFAARAFELYPELKATKYGVNAINIKIAMNDNGLVLNDVSRFRVAQAALPLILFGGVLGAAMLAQMLNLMAKQNPNLWNVIKNDLTPDAVAQIQNAPKAQPQTSEDQKLLSPSAMVDEKIVVGNGKGGCVTISGIIVAPGTYCLLSFDRVPPGKPHYPYSGDHYHYAQANMRPDGKCFWNGNIPDDKPKHGALNECEAFR